MIYDVVVVKPHGGGWSCTEIKNHNYIKSPELEGTLKLLLISESM